MKRTNNIIFTLCCFVLLYVDSAALHAQQANINDLVTPIGDDYQNSINILNNRFRIDSDVEEVTMVFFREKGSMPVVLVRPDGSKVMLEQDADDINMRWYETDSYDMVLLKNPMPGPWQAVGNILEGSRVMVIADITLQADPIPSPLYNGEILKQTARLSNAGQSIDFSPFRDVVTLSIDFVSNNNPNFQNFGLGSRNIAVFEDNGEGYDERNGDGVFTGEFNLTIPTGEWQPTFRVVTPMYTREQVNDIVRLLPNPIIIDAIVAEPEQGDHQLIIDVDREQIDMKSLLFTGVLRYPNGDEQKISLTDVNDEAKVFTISNYVYGVHRFKMMAFATSSSGRDVVIDMPEFTFESIAPPPPPEPEYERDEDGNLILDDDGNPIEIIPEPETEEGAEGEVTEQEIAEEAIEVEDDSLPVGLILGINLSILVLGVGVILCIVNIRNHPNNHIFIKTRVFAVETFGKTKHFIMSKLDKSKNKASDEDGKSKDKPKAS